WLRGKDLNLRPLGYEPNELPDCSTPHNYPIAIAPARQCLPSPPSRSALVRKHVAPLAWCQNVPAESINRALPAEPEWRHWAWVSPDHSITIYLAFDVVDSINQALAEIAAQPPVRGAEIGGLLLGRSEFKDRLTVWIDHFAHIPCSYRRGASWIVAEEDLDAFAERIAESREPRIVGLFRSHTRKDLFLSRDDIALFSHLFADKSDVFLLVKPFATRPNLGGFFYWEGESIRETGSYREFPFHRRELGGGDPLPAPASSSDWVHDDHFEAPAALAETAKSPPKRVAWMSILLGLITLCLAGFSAYSLYRSQSGKRITTYQSRSGAITQKPTTTPPEGTLRLSASEGERNVTFTWDRTSPIVAATTDGTATITEGSFHTTIDLGPEELRQGRLVYSRPNAISDTVSFRVQLRTGQGEPFSESLRFVSRGPAAAGLEPPKIVRPPKKLRVETKPKVATPPGSQPPAPPVAQTKPADVAAPSKIERPAPRREP
ncbi:MAG: TonB family protein, partial [Bryobacterales bacterium]|nr:TonB family protein [Bryobacterales bacterium]